MLKVGTDCSGIESPIQALIKLKIPFEHVFSCEQDKHAARVIQEVYKPKYFYPDIMKRDHSLVPDVDLYVAGFPCQSWSVAGKHKGFEDKRGTIIFHIFEYLKAKRPKCFILENVDGMLTKTHIASFNYIVHRLGKDNNGQLGLFKSDNLGYSVFWGEMNAKDYGIPQNRNRVFIVGFREDVTGFKFPEKFPLELRLKDLLEPEVDKKYYLSDKQVKSLTSGMQKSKISTEVAATLQSPGHTCGNYKGMNMIQEPLMLNFKNSKTNKFKDKKLSLRSDNLSNCLRINPQLKTDNYIIEPELKKIGEINKSQSGSVYDVKGLAVTQTGTGGGQGAKTGLYAIQEPKAINGYSIRRLTPLECLRLMGFPDWFYDRLRDMKISDTQIYKQAGNSIVVNVLVELIREALSHE